MIPAGSARSVTPDEPELAVDRPVWWWCWVGSVVSAIVFFMIFAPTVPSTSDTKADVMGELVPLIPLALSVMVRWLALPFCLARPAGFVAYLAGLTLGEATAVLAAMSGGSLGRQLFYVGLLAILQFVPLFLPRARSSS